MPVAVCTELISLERYYEYVAYAFIAFPGLLFHDSGGGIDLLRLVTNCRLTVELYRDIVSYLQVIC